MPLHYATKHQASEAVLRLLLDAHPEAACVLIGTEVVPLGTTELRLAPHSPSRCLTALPESIGKLRALTTLNVSGNQLTELPAAIGSLAALTALNVSGNQLMELPAVIGSLAALTELWVDNNQLTELPAAIGSLTALSMLGVSGNPLQLPPLAVAERGPAAIRAYFDDLRCAPPLLTTINSVETARRVARDNWVQCKRCALWRRLPQGSEEMDYDTSWQCGQSPMEQTRCNESRKEDEFDAEADAYFDDNR